MTMKNTTKNGRRYVEVSYYDNELMCSLSKGTHAIHIGNAGSLQKSNVAPDFLPVLAVLLHCQHEMSEALMESSAGRPKTQPISKAERDAWDNLIALMGPSANYIEYPSAYEVIEKFFKIVSSKIKEIEDFPALKEAYDNYIVLSKLCLVDTNSSS